MTIRAFLVVFCLILSPVAFSQIGTTSDTARLDTIFFLNGEVRAVKVVDTVSWMIRFLPENPKGKVKVLEVTKDQVFSVRYSDGQERLVYFYDTTIGNVFTVLEAKMYMLGEREADQNYKNKWPFIIGLGVGLVSPIALSNAVALSPVAPAVTPLHTYLPTIRINTKKIANKDYLKYDTYLMGYEKVARKKNFMNSIKGAGIGLSIGLAAWLILK